MKTFRAAILGLMCLVSVGVAHADGAPDLSLKTAAVTQVDENWRGQLPHDPQGATDAYLKRLSSAAQARANSYFEGGYWLILWNALLGVLSCWILLATGMSSHFRDRVEKITRIRFLQGYLVAVWFLSVTWVLALPLTIYQWYFREHQYGLLNQTFLPWFREQLISLAVSLVLVGLMIAVVYAVVRKWPRTWPIWGALVGVLFACFGAVIAPVYIDPLFNTYKPLGAGATRDAILSMARANGIPATEVYEFDASRQSDRISANVSGFLGTTAIRLNDNLLKRTSLAETKAVMGHEMGHYVLNHIYKWTLEFALIIVAAFAWIKFGFDGLSRRFGAKWEIRGEDDLAGLPVAMILITVFAFALTPLLNTMTRTQEAEADMFGLNAAREPDGFAEATLKLTEYRKPDPSAVEEFVFFDHPSARTRIFSAMRWKAENLNH